jgi:hypothetical protein
MTWGEEIPHLLNYTAISWPCGEMHAAIAGTFIVGCYGYMRLTSAGFETCHSCEIRNNFRYHAYNENVCAVHTHIHEGSSDFVTDEGTAE